MNKKHYSCTVYGSHNTIHTFKIYFVTVFSVSVTISSIQMDHLITTPISAKFKLSKVAPSKLILNRLGEGGFRPTTSSGSDDLVEGHCTSQNSYNSSLAFLIVSPTSHTGCFNCNLLHWVHILLAIIENKATVFEEVSTKIYDTRSPKLPNTCLRGKVNV